jgi:hypothetical protein
VQFGLPLTGSSTIADGESLVPPWPVDSDISDSATTTEPDYVVCVTCHNPHGTGVTDHYGVPSTNSNKMLRGNWLTDPSYCQICHL